MNRLSIVESLMIKLSTLPGLGFLSGYVTDFHSRKSQIRAEVDRYKGYVSTVRGTGAEAAQAVRGKPASDSSDDDSENDADDETYDDESFMQ